MNSSTIQEYNSMVRSDRVLVTSVTGDTTSNYVVIEYKLDTDWIEADRFTTTGARIVYLGTGEVRIRAVGTAKFGVC
jgi:hypothetical protein